MIRFLFIYVQIEQENRAGKALFNFFCIEMRSLFWNFLRWDLHHFLRWDLHFGIFTKIYLLERQIYIEGASETRNRDRKEEGGEERERECLLIYWFFKWPPKQGRVSWNQEPGAPSWLSHGLQGPKHLGLLILGAFPGARAGIRIRSGAAASHQDHLGCWVTGGGLVHWATVLLSLP